MGLDALGIGALSDLAATAINKIWPDKTEQEKAKLVQEMAIVNAQIAANQGQLDVNKVEAANPSTFVSGWRPFIGWVCGCGCAINWLVIPLVRVGMGIAGKAFEIHSLDFAEMGPGLLGLLGLGGLRTYEKINGVASK